MKEYPQWVLWRFEKNKDGKNTKVLYSPNTKGLGDSTDPKKWADFNKTVEAFNDGGFDGIGFVFDHTRCPIMGIDIDHIETPERVNIAKEIIKQFDSYSEKSPSGTGCHIYIKAKKNIDKCKNTKMDLEFYDSERFFTVTGNSFGSNTTINDRQESLEWFENNFFPKKEDYVAPQQNKTNFSDREVMEKMFVAKNGQKIKDLFYGTGGEKYESASSADQALANHIAFYTQDPEQIKRIMRASVLVREKWERPDYLDRPIKNAIATAREFYTPKINVFNSAPNIVERIEDFKIIPFNDLPDTYQDEDWILKDFFCKGGLFNLSAYNKTGKTAFLTCFYKAMADGNETFIDKKIKPAKVLHISEEYERSWIKKKNDFKKASVDIAMNPFKKSNNVEEWRQKLEIVLKICKEKDYEMVVFDTIDQFWGVQDENDSVDTSTNIEALRILTKEDICVVSVLHTRKNGGVVGKDTRGSGAINDKVDGIISFNRLDEEDITDNRRVISVGNGRFYDEPFISVVEFDIDKKMYFKVADSTYEAKKVDDGETLMPFIPPGEYMAAPVSQIYEEMKKSDERHLSANKIKNALSELVSKGIILKKLEGNTSLFWRRSVT